MAISSLDGIVSSITAGQSYRSDYAKITAATAAYAAGNWYELSQMAGYPVANTYPGATLVAQTPFDISPGWGIYHGGNVASNVKNILNVGAFASVATAVPSLLYLIDIVTYYPLVNNLVTTAQTLVNANTVTASSSSGLLLTSTNQFGSSSNPYTSVVFTTTGTLPTGLSLNTTYYLVYVSSNTQRVATSLANAIAGTVIAYTDGGSGTHTMTVTPNRYGTGAGLRIMTVSTNSTGTGSATPVVSASGFQYTNSSGTTGRVLGAVVNYTTGASNIPLPGKIPHSGVAAANFGPFLPLQAGDNGVSQVTQYQMSTAYGGFSTQQVAVVICKPICAIPIVTSAVAGERSLVIQMPSMPIIPDGACLSFCIFTGSALAASTPIMGYADFAWG